MPDNLDEEEPLQFSVQSESLDLDLNRPAEGTDDEDSAAHDEALEASDEDSEVFETRGVRSECPLNKLVSFHCIDGFPPDVMHDLMEGKF